MKTLIILASIALAIVIARFIYIIKRKLDYKNASQEERDLIDEINFLKKQKNNLGGKDMEYGEFIDSEGALNVYPKAELCTEKNRQIDQFNEQIGLKKDRLKLLRRTRKALDAMKSLKI